MLKIFLISSSVWLQQATPWASAKAVER